MSHIVIIIQRSAPTDASAAEASTAPTYRYEIPVPHDATPQQVGELVRRTYKRLEGNDAD